MLLYIFLIPGEAEVVERCHLHSVSTFFSMYFKVRVAMAPCARTYCTVWNMMEDTVKTHGHGGAAHPQVGAAGDD
jgi:hypothetical protein